MGRSSTNKATFEDEKANRTRKPTLSVCDIGFIGGSISKIMAIWNQPCKWISRTDIDFPVAIVIFSEGDPTGTAPSRLLDHLAPQHSPRIGVKIKTVWNHHLAMAILETFFFRLSWAKPKAIARWCPESTLSGLMCFAGRKGLTPVLGNLYGNAGKRCLEKLRWARVP